MYTGFSSLVKREGIEEGARFASEMGFSSVEFFDMAGREGYAHVFDGVASAKAAKKALSDRGLSVSCYSVGGNLVSIKDGVHRKEQTVAELKNHAKIAAALGSPFLHHTLIFGLTVPPAAPSLDDVLMPTVDAAVDVARYCEELGLTCIYEGQGMYFNGVEAFGRFFREMKKHCPNVGVCGDLGNTFFVDEAPVDFFSAFADDICHVHIKDYRYTRTPSDKDAYAFRSRGGAYLKSALVGAGDANVGACLEILKQHGYRGAFSLEDDSDMPLSERISAARAFFA